METDEKSWDPELIRILKDGTEVIFPRLKTEKPITDFGSKMENFSDVLDVRIGTYKHLKSLLSRYYLCKFRSNVAIQKIFCDCIGPTQRKSIGKPVTGFSLNFSNFLSVNLQ